MITKQSPARGISVDADYVDAKVFNIECDCSSDDHAVKMWIEVSQDSDIPNVEVSFYVTTWSQRFENLWDRIKIAFDVLFLGVHKQQHSILLNKQSAVNFANAIIDTVHDLETSAPSIRNS